MKESHKITNTKIKKIIVESRLKNILIIYFLEIYFSLTINFLLIFMKDLKFQDIFMFFL